MLIDHHTRLRRPRSALVRLAALGAVAALAGHAATANAAPPPAPTSASQLAELERALAQEAKLETILRVALANNPDLREARQRAQAAHAGAPAGSRLPDPEFEYQLWAAPLARPYAINEAQMHMFGLSQAFPAPGTLGARGEAALAEATVATQAGRAREQDLIARIRRAFAEYRRTESELRIHREHGKLAAQVLELARLSYQAGRGTQQDVLRASLEMTRLHGDVIAVEAEQRAARALLNALMARPLAAPLGPAAAPELSKERLGAAEARTTPGDRPELIAAHSAIVARQKELDGARAGGRWPSFMLGLQYMYMPMEEEPHNYGVTFSMSLPWLNPRYGEEERAATARVAAEQSALASSENAARYELYAAVERLKAARESLGLLEHSVLPEANRNFESAQAVYRGGQGDSLALFDALRALLDVRIEHERALARVETAFADVERAAGADSKASQRHKEGGR